MAESGGIRTVCEGYLDRNAKRDSWSKDMSHKVAAPGYVSLCILLLSVACGSSSEDKNSGSAGNSSSTGGSTNQSSVSANIGGKTGVGSSSVNTGGKTGSGSSSVNTGGTTGKGSSNVGGSVTEGGGGSGTTTRSTSGTGGAVVAASVPRWVGRVDTKDPSAVKFAWQGAGFVAMMNGSTITVKLRSDGSTAIYFQPVIDGVKGERFKVNTPGDQSITIASGLSSGEHLVELYRETEGMYGTSTFLGFVSGAVTGVPAASGRLIEAVGDSISAGYGNLGSEPHPNWVANPACHWTAENSSWYATYAAVAGRAFNAEVSTVARSGWGAYRDADKNTNNVLASVYENALGPDDSTPWGFTKPASVVVINLGTNDWSKGDPGTPYETAYVKLVNLVRSHNPDAWIFLTIGSMFGDPELSQVKARLATVVKTVTDGGDNKVTTFDFGSQNLGADGTVPTGCDWHPNAADDARMAGILQQQITSKLGW
jgi:lysophospholipase L1-like esterase